MFFYFWIVFFQQSPPYGNFAMCLCVIDRSIYRNRFYNRLCSHYTLVRFDQDSVLLHRNRNLKVYEVEFDQWAIMYFYWITESIRKQQQQVWKMKNIVKQKTPFALASWVYRCKPMQCWVLQDNILHFSRFVVVFCTWSKTTWSFFG